MGMNWAAGVASPASRASLAGRQGHGLLPIFAGSVSWQRSLAVDPITADGETSSCLSVQRSIVCPALDTAEVRHILG